MLNVFLLDESISRIVNQHAVPFVCFTKQGRMIMGRREKKKGSFAYSSTPSVSIEALAFMHSRIPEEWVDCIGSWSHEKRNVEESLSRFKASKLQPCEDNFFFALLRMSTSYIIF